MLGSESMGGKLFLGWMPLRKEVQMKNKLSKILFPIKFDGYSVTKEASLLVIEVYFW